MQNDHNLPIQQNEEMQVAMPMNEALALYATASTLQLSPEESAAMMAPFDETVVGIRPDGHLYIPQTYYRERLNATVGVGQWGLIVKGTTQEVNGSKVKMLLNGLIVIRKCFVGEAVGEAEIHGNNENQSMASVWESAKSDCITRCCKDLSIGNQIYQPNFINAWKEKFAIQVWINGKQVPQWRKKDGPKLPKEVGIVGEGKQPDAQQGGGGGNSQQNPSGNLPWLNKTTRQGGSTKEWTNAVEGLLNGTLTIEALEETFKISKGTKLELQEILKKKPASGSQASTQAKETAKIITGDVWAKLEKCKTKEDVDALCVNYKNEITSWGEWRFAFQKRKNELPLAKDLKTANA